MRSDVTRIMGVLNVTPDSFSDGGRYLDADAAVQHGLALAAAGADIVDVGGESTRPGSVRVAPGEEEDRILPVVARLAAEGVTVSVDTLNASTAMSAAAAGATIVNDVSGGLADEEMFRNLAGTPLIYVLGHWRGPMSDGGDTTYDDVVADVRAELRDRVRAAKEAGLAAEQLVLDPGLGFGKAGQANWKVLAHLEAFCELGLPVMVGASRKRFVSALLPEGSPMAARDLPTAVISVLAAQSGAWAVRVHDVAGTRLALRTFEQWEAAR